MLSVNEKDWKIFRKTSYLFFLELVEDMKRFWVQFFFQQK